MKTRFVWVMIAFLVVFGLYAIFNSTPWGVAQLKAYSGGEGLLDMRFWYTPKQALDVIQAWGPLGRSHYLGLLLPLDLLFPVAYVAFLGLLLLYLLKKVNPASPWVYFLPLTAALAGACDLLENALVSLQVLLFPDPWMPLFWPMSVLTAGKWIFVGLAVLSGLLLTSAHLFQRLGRLAKKNEG